MALTFTPGRAELVSAAKASGDTGPTYIFTHDFDVAEWMRRACAIVPRNLDLTLIDAYTLGNTHACPGIPVDGSIVRNWLDIAQFRLNRKDATGTSAAYREAARLAVVDDNDDAELAHEVCLRGTVSRYATDVLPACDRAVALSWDSGPFRSSRAAARAQIGNRLGAIEDLRFFLDWADGSGLFRPNVGPNAGVQRYGAVGQRELWISKLAGGQNPFTPDLLSSLWTEYLEDQGGNTYQTCPVNVGAWMEWVERPTSC